MKKFCLLVAVLICGAAYALGDSIGSFATGASNLGNINSAMNFAGFSTTNDLDQNGFAPTYTLDPAGVWAPPPPNSTWIGYSPTAGPLGGVNPPAGFYTFTTTFFVNGPYFGQLTVDAHDAVQVFGSNDLPLNSFQGTFFFSGTPGFPTLTFVVQADQQGDMDPSGMAFSGSFFTTNGPPIPEPSSLLLLGTGLFGTLFLLRARRQHS